MLIYSCNTPNQVTKIDYSVKDEVLTYYNKDNDIILPGLASVKENNVPTLYIKNYNPLAMTITVTQGPNTSNYTQTNNNSILTSYLKLPDIAKSIVETPDLNKFVPKFNQLKRDEFQNLKNAIKETDLLLENYNNFYNSIIELDRVYKSFLIPRYLDSVEFCKKIDYCIKDIQKKYLKPYTSDQPTPINLEDIIVRNVDFPDSLFNSPEIIKTKLNSDSQNGLIRVTNIDRPLTPNDGRTCDCNTPGKVFQQYPKIGEDIKYYNLKYEEYFQLCIDSLTASSERLEKFPKLDNDSKMVIGIAKAKVELVKGIQGKFKSEYSQNVSDIIDTKLNSLVDLRFIKSHTAFNTRETDDLNVEIKIDHPNSPNQKLIKGNISLPVQKYLKIDYSTGIFFSGIYDQDSRKLLDTIDGEVKWYKTETTNGGKLSYGAMGSINFHTQKNTWFNYGASISAGLMFNQDTKLIISPSLIAIFGANQRFIVHLGMGFGRVDRVYSIYGDQRFKDGDYNPEKKTETSKSWSLGLSWNLSKN